MLPGLCGCRRRLAEEDADRKAFTRATLAELLLHEIDDEHVALGEPRVPLGSVQARLASFPWNEMKVC